MGCIFGLIPKPEQCKLYTQIYLLHKGPEVSQNYIIAHYKVTFREDSLDGFGKANRSAS